jgi:hypothetical protein
MARDFWPQTIDHQENNAALMSTDVRAIPLDSPRVLETFWTRLANADRWLFALTRAADDWRVAPPTSPPKSRRSRL